jgi:hypothetical protein
MASLIDGKPPLEIGITPQEEERIARIEDELREGIGRLSDIGVAVSIFGSARSLPDDWEYREARSLARRLSAKGITVITGGGPGVMEAGNLGATEAAGKSDCRTSSWPTRISISTWISATSSPANSC